MVIRILPGLERRVEDLSEILNKEIENIKKIIRDKELNK